MTQPWGSQPGPQLPNLHWVRLLGRGGFADVHQYRQVRPERDVAVKMLRTADDDLGRDNLLREANAMARVSGHPAVVELYQVSTTSDGRECLLLEYCPVAGLGKQVRDQPLSLTQSLEIMIRVCGAVETLHRAGLVHRDIKPSNIMLTNYSQAVLGDFGAAHPIGEPLPSGGAGFSLLWAAPEQLAGSVTAHPSLDVWSLAATAWTLLSGRSPFETLRDDNSEAALATRIQAGKLPLIRRGDVPDELVTVLKRALTVAAPHRTPSAARLGEELQEIQRIARLPLTTLSLESQLVEGEPVIDPDRTRTRPIVVATPTAKTPQQATPLANTPEAKPTAPQSKTRAWTYPLLGVLGALVTIAIVTATLLGGGQRLTPEPAGPEVQAQEPINAVPAPVTSLEGQLRDGRVYWTWQHPRTGKTRFIYSITREGHENLIRSTQLLAADAAAVPGKMCIEVQAKDDSGRASAPQTHCLKVP